MPKSFYITTPLYYVNDVPHIGHAYTTIAADALARYKRLTGYEVYFLTGTDEHGQKIAEAAEKAGTTPQAYVDQIVPRFTEAWKKLEITYDDFIRTTEPRHVKTVQAVLRKLYEAGDIYQGTYEGWYCTPCESFWTELELVKRPDGTYGCPTCSRPVERVQEESYFFRLSKYQQPLLTYLEEHPDFVQPAARRNEVLNFIKSGLKDLSITRTNLKWGIPFPLNDKHVTYVWFDALLNYVSAIDYGSDNGQFEKMWPADLHLMGKEIVRFHAVIWPTMLIALGLPLPRVVFGHGWWTIEGKKMSKSVGNVVDPLALAEEFGADVVRYILLREVPFGVDGDFSRKALLLRYNADLANDLGNLLNRTLTMTEKYFSGKVPMFHPEALTALDQELCSLGEQTPGRVAAAMEQLMFHEALGHIWALVGRANRLIEERAPWKLAKEDGRREAKAELENLMYELLEVLRLAALLLFSVMPATSLAMLRQLGLEGKSTPLSWGAFPTGTLVQKGDPLFPRKLLPS